MRATRGAWIGLLGLLLGCLPAPEGVVTLSDADLWVGRSARPPGPDAAWTPIELPDRWMVERRRRSLEGWYRLRLPPFEPTSEPWGLVARVYPNAAFFVNGVEIGRGGRMEPPVSRNSFRPLHFSIPHSLLGPGENWLHVRIVATPGSVARLQPIRVGPLGAVLPYAERERIFATVVPLLSVSICALLAGTLLLTARSAPSGQAAFGAALLCIPIAGISLVAPDAPLPNRLVEWITGSALHWSTLFFAIGAERRAGRRLPFEPAWVGTFVLLTGVYAAVPPYFATQMWLLWGALSAPLFVSAAVRLIWDGWRARERSSIAAGAVAIALLASAAVDRFSDAAGEYASELSAVIALLFLLGFGGYLLVTVLHALRTAESVNRLLDARVAAREKELALSYSQQRDAERERALAGERTRLMRDMHDGTGGRLVSALSLLRSGDSTPAALEEALVEAIDDLHLTIDSLRPGAMDLPSVLGLLRARLERQLRPHRVRLEWAIGDAGEGVDLSPDQVLHVIRIVQEAVANALRHAGGSSVRVATGREHGATWFEIADDGRGGARPRLGGRGLANLQQRATLLGGELDLRSEPGGTRVRVTLAGDGPSGARRGEARLAD